MVKNSLIYVCMYTCHFVYVHTYMISVVVGILLQTIICLHSCRISDEESSHEGKIMNEMHLCATFCWL